MSYGCWSGSANQLLANKSALNTAWMPYEVRWLFSRSICTWNKRKKWLTHSSWGIFADMAMLFSSPFGCTNPPPPVPPFLPRTCWKWLHKLVKLKVSWRVVQTLVVKGLTATTTSARFQADAKSCRDISHLFQDHLIECWNVISIFS